MHRVYVIEALRLVESRVRSALRLLGTTPVGMMPRVALVPIPILDRKARGQDLTACGAGHARRP
jgi:hypothetical protein